MEEISASKVDREVYLSDVIRINQLNVISSEDIVEGVNLYATGMVGYGAMARA